MTPKAQEDKRIHFTKEALLALACPDGADRLVAYDDEARGLGVRVFPNGRRVFFWYGRTHGRPVRKNLGEYPKVAIPEARRKANAENATKTTAMAPEPDRSETLTIAEAFEATLAKSRRGERAISHWDYAVGRFTSGCRGLILTSAYGRT